MIALTGFRIDAIAVTCNRRYCGGIVQTPRALVLHLQTSMPPAQNAATGIPSADVGDASGNDSSAVDSDSDSSNAASVACVHCGLPAPRPRDASKPAFCCAGCRGAWELIHGWGLEDYYALRDETTAEKLGDSTSDPFADLDDPKLLSPSVVQTVAAADGTPLSKVRLSVAGLHCAACAWLIEQAPNHVAGWYSAEVKMHSRSIELVYDSSIIALSELGRILNRIGYHVRPLEQSGSQDADQQENRQILTNVAIAGFCAANAMWIAVALYAGMFSGIAETHRELLRFAGVILGPLLSSSQAVFS